MAAIIDGAAALLPAPESDRTHNTPSSIREALLHDTPDAESQRKLQPKLRMYTNGSTEVNAIRAQRACAVSVPEAVAADQPIAPQAPAAPTERELILAEQDWVENPRPDATVSVFVQLAEDRVGAEDAPSTDREGFSAAKANLLTARLSISEAKQLPEEDAVAYVELGQPLAIPDPIITAADPEPPPGDPRAIGEADSHNFGAGVLVGIIDVGGFDFAHPDFLDEEGNTRFICIWDQGGDTHPTPAERRDDKGAFPDFGSEVRQEELNMAIAAARDGGLPAQLLERQSQMHQSSHATHVASIAAGNAGVCRRAWIAGVLIELPESDYERRRSFYDSTRIAHAVDYLTALAEQLKAEYGLQTVPPVAINVSLGTNGHAHDDSAAITRWIDFSLAQPGRAVCVAAGNAGQERAMSERDLGFAMGRVHTSGQVRAKDLTADIEWVVFGNGREDASENELEVWYGPQDRFAVTVKPSNEPWSAPVEPGAFIENQELADGSFFSVYNELYHPANGANCVSVYLSPFLSRELVIGTQLGVWLVRLIGRDVRDGSYDGWIERDDPGPVGVGARVASGFPSFFSDRSYVDSSTVSSLACGQRIISVANLDAPARKIAVSSSQGPTRDGRNKPEIAAPGTKIVAANGFADGGWVAMSGTSMASPYVAGVSGLMLAANPRLTAAQIAGAIRRTARPLPGADFAWRNDAGYGEIWAEQCVLEAMQMISKDDVTRKEPPA